MLLGSKALEASRARASAHLPPSTHKAAGSAVTIRHSLQTGDLRTLTRKLPLFFLPEQPEGGVPEDWIIYGLFPSLGGSKPLLSPKRSRHGKPSPASLRALAILSTLYMLTHVS